MKEIAQKYQDLLVQIATPYSTGTGFFLKEANLIVTKEHIIRDNRRAVIEGTLFAQQMADIIYVDQKYDLAFLAVPPDLEIPTIKLASDPILEEAQNIVSIGHRFGQKIAVSEGEIITPQYDRHHIIYIKHNAVLNPGNSGGPLINTKGEVIGINTFIALDDNFIGYALPVSYLHETVYDFLSGKVRMALRCHSCSSIVFENTIVNKHCPRCNSKVELPSQVEEYEPSGMSNTIEILLNKMGHDSQLSRRGPNNWEIKEGSAKINISYYEKNGLIIGDAYLCSLPEEGTKPLYEYLLKQNYKTEGLTLSVKKGDIVLSLLIYDRYLNVKTGTKLLQHLFERADYYDNVLVEEFGALWKKEEEQQQEK